MNFVKSRSGSFLGLKTRKRLKTKWINGQKIWVDNLDGGSLVCRCKVVIQEMEMNLHLKYDFIFIRLVMITKKHSTK